MQSSGLPELQVPGDVFASGGALVTKGRVAGDAHVAGFDLDLSMNSATTGRESYGIYAAISEGARAYTLLAARVWDKVQGDGAKAAGPRIVIS